jgi:hypothetical protein
LDNLDDIEIDNYRGFFSNRIKSRNKSGGVCLFIKTEIMEQYKVVYCNEHCNNCKTKCCVIDGILWCIVGDVLLGVVYVPPESSIYNDGEIFDNISFTILELCLHFQIDSIFVMDDFNARTGIISDSIVPDKSLLKNNVLPDCINDNVLLSECTDINQRISQDKRMNNRGYKLIDLCRNHDEDIKW